MSTNSEERREELLLLARQSRLKWVLDAREVIKQPAKLSAVIPNKDKKSSTKITVSESLKAKIPAAECVQNVLNYLSELKDDGECFDVETIAVGIIDHDEFDYDMFLNNGTENLLLNGDGGVASYNVFINKLLHPNSAEIVKQLQQFVTKFNSSVRDNRLDYSKRTPVFSSSVTAEGEDAQVNALNAHNKLGNNIWTFLDHVYEAMRTIPLWSDESTTDFEESKTHCEKFLFIKLYPVLFGSDLEDSFLNGKTKDRIEALSFLTATHLDIKLLKNHSVYEDYRQGRIKINYDTLQNASHTSNNNSNGSNGQNGAHAKHHSSASNNNGISIDQYLENIILKKPIEHLRELEQVKCPQDKLNCVSKCINSIAEVLKECSAKNGKVSGTDEFLPVMILVIKNCNPVNIHSNLKYVMRYLRPSKLIGKEGYLLTSFVSSVTFIDNVDSKALTIDPEEFERNIARARAVAIERNKKQQQAQQTSLLGSKAMVSASSASGSSSGDLTAGEDPDVDALLAEYKKSVSVCRRSQFVSAREISARRLRGVASSVEK